MAIWSTTADHLAFGVDQRAARVAGIDRGVGLDGVGDGEAVGCLDRAVEAGDDAGREAPGVFEGGADRGHRGADVEVGGVGEFERVQFDAIRDRTDHREVGGVVDAEDFGLVGRAVLEDHLDRGGFVDDVGGGDDVAFFVDLEAGAGRHRFARFCFRRDAETFPATAARARFAEGACARFGFLGARARDRGLDLDHAGGSFGVERFGVVGGAGRVGDRAGGRGRLLDGGHLGGAAAERADGEEDDNHDEAAGQPGGDDRRRLP